MATKKDSVGEAADQSIVVHRNVPVGRDTLFLEHKWYERKQCPLCQSDDAAPKEPPPPAVTEQIEDIIDPADAPFPQFLEVQP